MIDEAPKTDAPTLHTESASVMSIIQQVVQSGANGSIEVAERMLAMQERIMDRNAKQAFAAAMCAAQAEMPKIKRNKENQQTSSMYADLEQVTDAAVPIYTKHGFSMSYGTADGAPQGMIRITCKIAHVLGHERDEHADVPLDLNGLKGNPNKTPTHAFGSTCSYGRRYLCGLVWNLTYTNEDTDGNNPADSITVEQATELRNLGKEAKADIAAFLKWIGAESFDAMPAALYTKAKQALNDRKRANAAKAGK